MPPLPLIHAFGLALSAEEWTKKSFCQVSANEIRERIRKGMSPSDAITTKPDRPGLTRFRAETHVSDSADPMEMNRRLDAIEQHCVGELEALLKATRLR
jgi:hypothetical protein